MHKRTVRLIAGIAVVIVASLAGADRASAAGTVNISSCQTLSQFGTVYRLTTDLSICGNCLIVANDQITIDLQGHSITSTCAGSDVGIYDGATRRDGVVVRNGTVSGFAFGVLLQASTRVSVLGITATDNQGVGIATGPQGLVKSSEASGSDTGIFIFGARGQVQQSNAHDNNASGIVIIGDNCLITANMANSNANGNSGQGILAGGHRCTVSFNTANNNGRFGIRSAATGTLVTSNTALNNHNADYAILCPGTVTNNDSTTGFPASYVLSGNGCQTSNNH